MKINMLYWGDAPTIATGFGIVAKHILGALHATGKYEIDILGINYFGSFYNKEELPYHIVPARLLNPSDPYGNEMLIKSLSNKKYDILFIINDTYVTNNIAAKVQEYKTKYNQNLKVIYYYPVDCAFRPEAGAMVNLADQAITYTNWAATETMKALPSLKNLKVIYHGSDIDTFKPLSVQKKNQARGNFFGLQPDDETFVWINVNRNSVRKNLPKTIWAFNEFKRNNPNRKTLLYLHTVPNENGIDLFVCLDQLGLSQKSDVIFPVNYSPANPFFGEILNEFYNAADCFLSNSLGEGWGIGQCEAMAAGTLVLAPDNTSTPEILGSQRGYTYPCEEISFVDNSGYRKDGRIETIVNKMEQVYATPAQEKIALLQAARKFTTDNSWANINKKWISLFEEVHTRTGLPSQIVSENL